MKRGQILHDAMARCGVGNAQGTHHREGLAAAMADHGNPVDAQEQSSTVLRMVQPLLDAFQVAAQECRTHLAATSPGQFSPQHAQQNAADGFQELQQHIAGESVTDHHIEVT